MNIRRYLAGEEPLIWEVVFQATRVAIARDYHPDLIERWAPHDRDMAAWTERLQTTKPFVALVEDQIVGMAEVDGTGFIDFFYVHPDFHRKGIGKALMEKILEEAKTLGVNRVCANVSLTAEPFFTAQGFEITERRRNIVIGHPAPQFSMAKDLPIETAE